jgi:CGNR zinc finger/Putative stress-induced transcription regulator
MSGEGPQPGGRPPAPGELGLVQAFINTHYDLVHEHGAEVLADVAALRGWLTEHDLIAPGAAVSDSDLRRALAAREALRTLAGGGSDPSTLAVLNGARIKINFGPTGPQLEPADAGTVDGALATLVGIVAREMLTGRWSRLKVCPGENCGWAFYDGSRNRTGRWCSMSVCGGRAKAKAHYHRQRELA